MSYEQDNDRGAESFIMQNSDIGAMVRDGTPLSTRKQGDWQDGDRVAAGVGAHIDERGHLVIRQTIEHTTVHHNAQAMTDAQLGQKIMQALSDTMNTLTAEIDKRGGGAHVYDPHNPQEDGTIQ